LNGANTTDNNSNPVICKDEGSISSGGVGPASPCSTNWIISVLVLWLPDQSYTDYCIRQESLDGSVLTRSYALKWSRLAGSAGTRNLLKDSEAQRTCSGIEKPSTNNTPVPVEDVWTLTSIWTLILQLPMSR
jgi:hypothetical protein